MTPWLSTRVSHNGNSPVTAFSASGN